MAVPVNDAPNLPPGSSSNCDIKCLAAWDQYYATEAHNAWAGSGLLNTPAQRSAYIEAQKEWSAKQADVERRIRAAQQNASPDPKPANGDAEIEPAGPEQFWAELVGAGVPMNVAAVFRDLIFWEK